jgi:metal-responsive CopG/Arc/MetJ family transcriptional regulator
MGMKMGRIDGMTIKTAISIDESLYRQVQKLAAEMEISRSQVFAVALRSFLRQRQNRTLLEELNRAYAEPPSAAEARVQRGWRRRHRRSVKGEW